MKRIFLLLSVLSLASFIYAQSIEGTVEYQKKPQVAAVIELPYSENVINASLDDYLSRKGKSKSTDLKGFTTYRNTQQVLNDSTNSDLYFRIDRKSRKEKEMTVVSLLLRSPKDEPTTGHLHHLNMEEAKAYLNDLVPVIEAYYLELQIKDQNDAVIKAESKYNNMIKDGADLEKKRADIEKKMAENKSDQEGQLKTVEMEKQKLADRVSQRKA